MTAGIETYAFFLVPGFSAMAFFSATEPLRVANRLSPEPVFAWRLFSRDGGAVEASNGMRIMVDGPLDETVPNLTICAGFDPKRGEWPGLLAALRRMARRGATLGAMDTGIYALARAGLIGDRKITLHWEAVPAFREEFPEVRVSDELFEFHDRLFTCAGGTAALDMMLDMIGRHHGAALAAAVSEQFIHDRIRSPSDRQRLALAMRLGTRDSRILEIVGQMERHIEQPLELAALARSTAITRRQMERLFASQLAVGPAGYYRGLRLERARTLICNTDVPLIEVAMATGFTSESSLSRAYRQRFRLPPSADRAAMSHAFKHAPAG
ncbi:MAG: GlxA family transcriptional regulator [Pseudomonadota bacterium]